MKEKIELFDYANQILKELKKGVLITTKVDDEVNTMTISWGQIGIEWQRSIFTTFVRTGRHTHKMLEKGKAFTVNIPMEENANKILRFCGTKSGKDHNKIKELGLSLVEGNEIDVPGIKELPLTLECKVIYSQLQDKNAMPSEFINQFYPQDIPSDFHSANKDFHTMFIGEIVDAYIIW